MMSQPTKRFVCTILAAVLLLSVSVSPTISVAPKQSNTWWKIQSIDTVKFSRDLARESVSHSDFPKTIDRQLQLIAQTGATHVAIATPYDAEFRPILKLWVTLARKYGLNVWFRGNFSGWEGWFNYPRIDREGHLNDLQKFIAADPSLFRDTDIFEPCPECENGGAGDPRATRDVRSHRQFLIQEYQAANAAFTSTGVKPLVVFSMNADVAKLVMDEETTQALGGVIVADHYRQSPITLAGELGQIAKPSGGTIMLGEFGAPVPDIHGSMDESEQAAWINSTLAELSQVKDLLGVNYWVSFDGTTSLWREDGTPKPAVDVLTDYFTPEFLEGEVRDELGRKVVEAQVRVGPRETLTDGNGEFRLPTAHPNVSIAIHAQGFEEEIVEATTAQPVVITLRKSNPNLIFRFLLWLKTKFLSPYCLLPSTYCP